mmetsp:Transcript_26277/g.57567  ORF Transcript_26277/g.57567 Transcript_26277/m.57567 type:complete len:268 (-) Transcript_26277:434-1237(-)
MDDRTLSSRGSIDFGKVAENNQVAGVDDNKLRTLSISPLNPLPRSLSDSSNTRYRNPFRALINWPLPSLPSSFSASSRCIVSSPSFCNSSSDTSPSAEPSMAFSNRRSMAASLAFEFPLFSSYEVRTSINLPGVATRTSIVVWYRTVSASRTICGSRGIPPCRTMVFNGSCLLLWSIEIISSTIPFMTSPICTHSSRVGQRIMAVTRSFFWCLDCGCCFCFCACARSIKIFCSNGIKKAAVFPLPVGASHQNASVAPRSMSRGMANC